MALGRRNEERQEEFWVATQHLPTSPGHIFYEKLNGLLAEGGFDEWIENLCEPFYAKRGRPSIPPGVYFRMLLVGYFEGIGSQRGIAWRCSDSLSLRKFLGIPMSDDSPEHSSLSVIRERLSEEVHSAVFLWVLELTHKKGLLDGKTVGVDSTTLEANAAMKSIVRRDSGDDWKDYVTGLMRDAGKIGPDETPTIAEIKRFDKSRKGKKVSNDDWESPTDPDSRITKMKDGTTHLAYKAEHTVDLKSELILAAEIYHADKADTHTIEDSVQTAQGNLMEVGGDIWIKDAVGDKGYHSAKVGIRPVNPILHGGVEFPETRGTRFRRQDDGGTARERVAGSGEGAVLAADAAGVEKKRADDPRILRFRVAVRTVVLFLASGTGQA